MADNGSNGIASTTEAEAAAALGGADGLLKVQDLLFGSQLRSIEDHFGRLEARVIELEDDLDAQVKRATTSMENKLRAETETLTQRLKKQSRKQEEAEAELRAEVSKLGRELEDAHRRLEKRDLELAEEIEMVRKILTKLIESTGHELGDEFRRAISRVNQTLDQALDKLHEDKVDQNFLADRLVQLGLQLKGGNPVTPSASRPAPVSAQPKKKKIEVSKPIETDGPTLPSNK